MLGLNSNWLLVIVLLILFTIGFVIFIPKIYPSFKISSILQATGLPPVRPCSSSKGYPYCNRGWGCGNIRTGSGVTDYACTQGCDSGKCPAGCTCSHKKGYMGMCIQSINTNPNYETPCTGL